MAGKLHPTTRRMAESDPDYAIIVDDAGQEQVVNVARRHGPAARQIAESLGIGQLRQADDPNRGVDQVFDTEEDERRIKADREARRRAEREARMKTFGQRTGGEE